jgi:hypothetical protein
VRWAASASRSRCLSVSVRVAGRLSLSSGQCNLPLPVARRIHFRPHAEATCPNSCSLSGSSLAPSPSSSTCELSPIENANLALTVTRTFNSSPASPTVRTVIWPINPQAHRGATSAPDAIVALVLSGTPKLMISCGEENIAFSVYW